MSLQLVIPSCISLINTLDHEAQLPLGLLAFYSVFCVKILLPYRTHSNVSALNQNLPITVYDIERTFIVRPIILHVHMDSLYAACY